MSTNVFIIGSAVILSNSELSQYFSIFSSSSFLAASTPRVEITDLEGFALELSVLTLAAFSSISVILLGYLEYIDSSPVISLVPSIIAS